MNPCLIMDEDCTLNGNPTQLNIRIDMKDALGDLLDQLPTNVKIFLLPTSHFFHFLHFQSFYALETTMTDGKKPIYCFRIEHKVLKT